MIVGSGITVLMIMIENVISYIHVCMYTICILNNTIVGDSVMWRALIQNAAYVIT